MDVGDVITFICGEDSFSRTIIKKYTWASIDEMVVEIPFKRVMLHVQSIEEMKRVYSSCPDYDIKIKEHGLLGFELKNK